MSDLYRCDEGHWHEGHFTPDGSPCPGGTGLGPAKEGTDDDRAE